MVGTEVATALGYKDPHKALKQHVEPEDWAKCPLHTKGGIQQTKIINESGFYCLVLASKLEGAKKFKRWVTSEVLPTLRKTGTYLENFVDRQKNMWYNITVVSRKVRKFC